MRRTLIPWLAVFVIAIAAGGGAVVVLNATVFGPGAFVGVYLDAVARGDASGALGIPGVDAGGTSDLLLDDRALSGLRDLHQVSDTDLGAGKHRVVYSWTAPDGSGTSAFEVERIGSRFGIFPEWGFATSPIATVSLAVRHDPRFFVNGFSTTTGRQTSEPTDYAVLVPGSYSFGHDTTFLGAAPDTVLAGKVGTTVDAAVDVRAGAAFDSELDSEVHAILAECATQRVLFPTGCPFGMQIDDRIVSDPVWSIVYYPRMTIEPSEAFGTWQVDKSPATAHLKVDVKSLFDGSVSTLDQDVPFTVSYDIRVDGNTLRVSAKY
jgi:hypothetical protein